MATGVGHYAVPQRSRPQAAIASRVIVRLLMGLTAKQAPIFIGRGGIFRSVPNADGRYVNRTATQSRHNVSRNFLGASPVGRWTWPGFGASLPNDQVDPEVRP